MLAAYDLSQLGSLTLLAPFCVVTSLPHCNRNAGSCTDGYTTAIMHSNLKPSDMAIANGQAGQVLARPLFHRLNEHM